MFLYEVNNDKCEIGEKENAFSNCVYLKGQYYFPLLFLLISFSLSSIKLVYRSFPINAKWPNNLYMSLAQ